jgi:uncharacterized protein YkvS
MGYNYNMDTQTIITNMPSAESYSFKKYFVLVFIFIIGAIVAAYTDPFLPAPLSNTKRGYRAGFDAARKLVEGSSVGNLFKIKDDLRFITGTVLSINGNSLTIRVSQVNPFDNNPVFNERIVLLSKDTKIIKTSFKDVKVYNEELKKFMNDLYTAPTSTRTEPIIRPQSVVETMVSSRDISLNDSITVKSLTNIKSIKEFTAAEVRIEYKLNTLR